MIVSSELEKAWKEAGMAQVMVPSQKDGLPGRESNQGRPECKSEALLLSRLSQCLKVTKCLFSTWVNWQRKCCWMLTSYLLS